MKKLSREKRTQLMLVLALTAIAMVGLWFGVINAQSQKLDGLRGRKAAAAKKFQQITTALQNAPLVKSQLEQEWQTLSTLEADMAFGDLNSWAFNTIRQFKAPYKVEIPQFGQIVGPRDATLLPKFPYKQATLTVAGTAQFYDFGRFVADFENRFPYFRIANLSLEPAGSSGSEPERLAFKMEIIALVKPGNS